MTIVNPQIIKRQPKKAFTPNRVIQYTSILAYGFVKEDLNDRYQKILEGLQCFRDSTPLELAYAIGFHNPDFVRPRIFELAKEGYVVNPKWSKDYPTGKRTDTISGQTNVMFWRLATDTRPIEKIEGNFSRKTKRCTRIEVFNGYLKHNKPITDYELTYCLGRTDPNDIRPIRFAFVKKGIEVNGIKYHVVHVEGGDRECMVSHRTAMTWILQKDLDSYLESS